MAVEQESSFSYQNSVGLRIVTNTLTHRNIYIKQKTNTRASSNASCIYVFLLVFQLITSGMILGLHCTKYNRPLLRSVANFKLVTLSAQDNDNVQLNNQKVYKDQHCYTATQSIFNFQHLKIISRLFSMCALCFFVLSNMVSRQFSIPNIYKNH